MSEPMRGLALSDPSVASFSSHQSMQATANPLRKPRPARDQCILHARFYLTDEKGRLAGGVGTNVCLTAEDLWIMPELSIPVGLIDSVRIVAMGAVPPRRFLQILYLNPITSTREAVYLCKPDPVGIGLYRVKPLRDLVRRIEEHPRRREPSAPVVTVAAGDFSLPEAPALDRCEVCGTQPAYYVSYLFLVSAILLAYRSAPKRRIHCRKHNAIHGLGYYVLTVLTGWIGIGVFAYPFVVFAAGRNLTPSIGKAAVVLGILPSLVAAILLVRWLL